MAHPPNPIFVDWNLIKIWCCDKFFTAQEISKHSEEMHGDKEDVNIHTKSQGNKINFNEKSLPSDNNNHITSDNEQATFDQTEIKTKEMAKSKKNKKRSRCGTCLSCVNRDNIQNCQVCVYCLDKKRYGGPNKLKKPCIKRLCKRGGEFNGCMKFKCEFCKEIFLTKDSIRDHVRLQHEDNFKFWIESVKKKKVRKNTTYSKFSDEKKQADNTRQKQSQNYQQKLLKNFYTKVGDLFKCSLCNETFHTLASFKEHMSTAHKENYTKKLKFICDVCGAGFLRRQALTHHSQVHLPPVTCPQCDKPFATNMSLLKHKKFSCKNEVVLKFCKLCGKGVKTNYDLKRHVNNVHMNHRRFKCTICGNAFKTLTHFQRHCTGKHNMLKDNCKQYLVIVNPEVEKNKD